MYDLRARYYDPRSGRLSSFDSYEGSISDPQSLHKYIFTNGNPVSGIDPSGHMDLAIGALFGDLLLSTGLRILAFAPYVAAAAAGGLAAYGLLQGLSGAAAVQGMVVDWLSSGVASLEQAAVLMASQTAVVVKAMNDAFSKATRLTNQLRKLKIFPVIRSMGPAVFANDVAALRRNPAWFTLTYNGTGNPLTDRNRLKSTGAFKGTVPFGQSLDEYPFASTAQGGPRARVRPVPVLQNWVQGGLLSAFYRLSLVPSGNLNFLVVPIPL
jgi:hypothetical protein